MRTRIFVLMLITSVLLLNCSKKEIKEINIKNAIFKAEGSTQVGD